MIGALTDKVWRPVEVIGLSEVHNVVGMLGVLLLSAEAFILLSEHSVELSVLTCHLWLSHHLGSCHESLAHYWRSHVLLTHRRELGPHFRLLLGGLGTHKAEAQGEKGPSLLVGCHLSLYYQAVEGLASLKCTHHGVHGDKSLVPIGTS